MYQRKVYEGGETVNAHGLMRTGVCDGSRCLKLHGGSRGSEATCEEMRISWLVMRAGLCAHYKT